MGIQTTPAEAAPSRADLRTGLVGILAMAAACAIWGLSAIYYKLLSHVPAAEVLAHRTIWSALFFAAILWGRGRLSALDALRRPRLLALVSGAAVVIGINWLLFISSVQSGHVVQTSLGYYIFPLVSVGLGALIYGERPRPAQQAAIALAGVAVAVLILGIGVWPWISLALAFTFGLYGAAKKAIALGAMASVTAEVLILLPLALGWLWLAVPGIGAFHGTTALLLVATGPLTGVPLMLFSMASRRLSMASVGLIGYLNPSLQFFCATVLFGEVFTLWHGLAFALIWTALAIFSGEALARRRQVRARAGAHPVPHPRRAPR